MLLRWHGMKLGVPAVLAERPITHKPLLQPCSILLCICAVSKSEAGQQKRLLVLDSAWQVVEEIPVDLGPRHFAVGGEAPQLPAGVRSGDRWGPHSPRRHRSQLHVPALSHVVATSSREGCASHPAVPLPQRAAPMSHSFRQHRGDKLCPVLQAEVDPADRRPAEGGRGPGGQAPGAR